MIDLPHAWLRSCEALGAHGDLAGAGARVIARWAEPHRRYHDLAHLAAVLVRVGELADHAVDADTVRLAAWFHDAVYDPAAGDNERRSADLAREVLAELRVDESRVAEVARLVLLTATHDPAADDRDGAVLCDADLAVLALPAEGYEQYARAVRAEHSHVDDVTFAAGRARVLRSLLERPALFHTAHGRARWEQPARANVSAELARLGDSV